MMRREWKCEWMKVRYRKIGLILSAFLGIIILWIVWAVRDAPPEEIWDGYRSVTSSAILCSSHSGNTKSSPSI